MTPITIKIRPKIFPVKIKIRPNKIIIADIRLPKLKSLVIIDFCFKGAPQFGQFSAFVEISFLQSEQLVRGILFLYTYQLYINYRIKF